MQQYFENQRCCAITPLLPSMDEKKIDTFSLTFLATLEK